MNVKASVIVTFCMAVAMAMPLWLASQIPGEPAEPQPDGSFLARKHTVVVQPAQKLSYRVSADALGRWAYHCHLLYHMEAGMFREVVVA